MVTGTETAKGRAVSSLRKHLLTILVFLVILALVWAASLVLHELGHGLTVQALGGKFTRLSAWPGTSSGPPQDSPTIANGGQRS
jgi:hypothetical protein